MPVPIVRDRARADVVEIASHIAIDQLAAALRFCDEAEDAFKLLVEHPNLGPEWEPALLMFPGLRFWPIKRFRNYLVVYVPSGNSVEILRVLHGARDVGRVMT